ncbi:unnamed protein product, partial [Lampetra fluviatilis]
HTSYSSSGSAHFSGSASASDVIGQLRLNATSHSGDVTAQGVASSAHDVIPQLRSHGVGGSVDDVIAQDKSHGVGGSVGQRRINATSRTSDVIAQSRRQGVAASVDDVTGQVKGQGAGGRGNGKAPPPPRDVTRGGAYDVTRGGAYDVTRGGAYDVTRGGAYNVTRLNATFGLEGVSGGCCGCLVPYMAIFAHVLLILVCVATLFLVTCSFSYLVTWRRRKTSDEERRVGGDDAVLHVAPGALHH